MTPWNILAVVGIFESSSSGLNQLSGGIVRIIGQKIIALPCVFNLKNSSDFIECGHFVSGV